MKDSILFCGVKIWGSRLRCLFFLLLFVALTVSCHAKPFLNGTSSLVYQPVHQVFSAAGGAQSKVQGFVRLGGGFTILPNASAIFDTFVTVSGPVDLRETGTIILASDLNFEAGVTLSSGGIIDGQNYALKLGGDLTLPTNKIFHIYSNTIIDGQGHSLTVGDYGQLFVDNSITLTLQNMVLKSGAKTSVFPPVRCAASNSRLVLDNVMLEPGSDVPFYQGQLYVYNDVLFSGTSALIYASPQASFITSGATLAFDIATTFSFAPATASNQQIILQDVTSRILLDGCTLECTDTGMRLTKGTVLCDNKVSLDSWSGEYFSSLTTVTSGIYSKTSGVLEMRCGWSPDGRFFSVTGDNSFSVRVYRVYGVGGLLGTTVATLPIGTQYILTHAWSPDMRSILIGGAGGSSAGWWAQYSFNGITFSPTVVNSRYSSDGTQQYPTAIEWSPDGNYFVFGTYNGGGFRVYKVNTFNGSGYTSVANGSWTGNIWSIKWHPSGNYLAVCGDAGLYIYRFNGTSVTSVASKLVGSTMVDVKWSPDGQYVALGVLNANTVDGNILANDDLRIYSFNRTTESLTPVAGKRYGTGSGAGVYGLSWHPDGKTLAVGGYGAANGGTNNPFNDTNLVRIYQFTGSSLNGLISYPLPSPLSNITYMWDCKWDPTGNYLCIIGRDGSYYEYYGILKANFVPGPTPQIMNNTQAFASSVANPYSLVSTVTSGLYKVGGGTPGNVRCCWNPNNGNYFMVAGDFGYAARVYQLYGANGLLGTTFATLPSGQQFPYSIAWTPDGQYVTIGSAIAGGSPGYWITYSFNGATFATAVSGASYGGNSQYVISLDWSPTYAANSYYLAVGTNGSGGCKIYSFNGSAFAQVGSTIAYTGNLWRIKWHPSGNYVALAGDQGINVYSFNSSTGPSASAVASRSVGTTAYDVSWSPNGTYMAAGAATTSVADAPILSGDNLRVYSFNTTANTLTAIAGRYYGTTVYGTQWHPSDNTTIAVVGAGAATTGNNPFTTTNLVRFYRFNGTSVLDGLLGYALPSPLSLITHMWGCAWDPTGTYLGVVGYNSSGFAEYYGIIWASPTSQTQAFTENTIFGGSDFSVTSALYGNPPITNVTSFVNNLATKQGGSFAITARDEVITGTMSSFTYTATNFTVGQHAYFWNRGWPLLGFPTDTLWTKFHAVGTQNITAAFANVANIDVSTNIMSNANSYLVDIGGPTNTSSMIWKGNPDTSFTVKRYHANPTQILGGDNALIESYGGNYWASINPVSKEISWGKGTTVGLDPKQTWTDASLLSGINRVGFCSSADAVFSNISIGAGCDLSAYNYAISGEHAYFLNGGWVLAGTTGTTQWIKYYAVGTTDADICVTNHVNISTSTLLMSNNNCYIFAIRGWSNTQSAIGKGSIEPGGSFTPLTGYSTAGPLPGYYWASVTQNGTSSVTLSWGTGTVVGQNVAQTYTDSSSPILNLDRFTFFTMNANLMNFSQIQVGYGADPGKQLVLDFKNNAVATLGQNQTLALGVPASQAFSDSLVFGNAIPFSQSALYGNPATTNVAPFVNNLLTKQGGSFAITMRDEVITGTMSSFTYTATNFTAGQHAYFWNQGWPLLGGVADTLWTKFHAVGTQNITAAFANVADINVSTNIMSNANSYLVDIGGPTNTSSLIWKGNPDTSFTVKRYHANPTQILGGDNALIESYGGNYWASINPVSKEISWGKGTTVGLDPKQTWTDASLLSGINRVGFCSSADAVFSNISIGAGMDANAYTYTCYNEWSYFPKGGWVLPGGTNDVKWIKYYFGGTAGDADVTFTNRTNIGSKSLCTIGPAAYLFNLCGNNNTSSLIAKGRDNRSHADLISSPIAGLVPGYFWVSLQQNGTSSVTLAWGTGTVIGQNVRQTYTDSSSPVLNIDRVALISYNASVGGGAQPFTNIQVGYGADPGTKLAINFVDGSSSTLYQNQSLALTPAQVTVLDLLMSANNLKVKILSGARVEIRGQVVDDSV